MRRLRYFAVITAVPFLASCAQLGSMTDILGSVLGSGTQQQQQAQIDAQIQQVDVNGQRLHVRTPQGQSGSVRFDSQTLVVYNQRQYPVQALEPGDVVLMQVHQTSQNELYASRIDVTQPTHQQGGVLFRSQ